MDIPSIPFNRCHAKTAPDDSPGTRVIDHCRIVGYVAKALLEILPPNVRDLLGSHPETTAALHDVGKVSPGFQLKYFAGHINKAFPDLARIPSSAFEKDHTKIGMASVLNHLKNRTAAKIVGAHHGGIRSGRIRRDQEEINGGQAWAEERGKLIQALIHEFGPVSKEKVEPPIQNIIAGFVSVADWIGSDEYYFPPAGVLHHFDLPEKARNAVKACGWYIPKIRMGLTFESIFDNPPYPVQQKFIDALSGPGLYILEAPMGAGKTEAALYVAYHLMSTDHNKGIFFGLPTRLTSEKIHERVQLFLERICENKTRPKLAHGHAWLKEFSAGGENFSAGKSWFDARKRRLLHPFAVGTIDQALLSVLNVKHFFVRTFALAGKVVILDEVHSYDLYTGTLMEEMISQLLQIGCTVIILSATLTRKRRLPLVGIPPDNSLSVKNDPYPLITFQNKTATGELSGTWDTSRDYQIEIRDLGAESIAAEAITAAEAGSCVLLVANTVARAQQWFDAVRAEILRTDLPLGMIHSKFPAFRRTELEAEWISKLGKRGDRPKGCILIGTQVLEQSIDIDSDFLITEIAPTDMLLQRMGRQWRHQRKKRPTGLPRTLIVSPFPKKTESKEDIIESFGRGNCYVYSPYLLLMTRQVWQHRSKINLPNDIRSLLEETYKPPDETASNVVHELYDLMVDMRNQLKDRADSAKSSNRGLTMREDREELVTRYSDYKTTDVLLVRQVDSTGSEADVIPLDGQGPLHLSKFEKNFPHTAHLHQNLISVPAWLLEKMTAKRPQWLEKHFFDPVPVWQWDEISGKLFMEDTFTGHTYDPHRGVRRWQEIEKTQYSDDIIDDADDFDPFDKNRMDW